MLVPLGVWLLSLSGLALEVALTRVFSATLWYHYAFLAISVALLGWGLGGLVLVLARRWLAPSLRAAAWFALGEAVAVPVCLWLLVRYPFRPDRLWLYYGGAMVPFLLGGMALAMVFELRRASAGRIYFADLLGASVGALAVMVLLARLGGEGTVLAVAFAPALAAICFAPRLAPAAALVVALCAGALVQRSASFSITSAPTKGMYQHLAATPAARVARTAWNAYSRVDAVEGLAGSALARLYIDADAWTNVQRWDGRLEGARAAAGWFRALPFGLVESPRTLVIGPGGGSDVLAALGAGAPQVTAVELNPLMLDFVRGYGDQAGRLYDHPNVETLVGEGRNYVRRSERAFDLIVLGFVDSWAAVASGGLSLSENYLYTVEAFRDFFAHLGGDGMLVILRWDVDLPRLWANAVALLGEEARDHVAAVIERRGTAGEPPQMSFMLRRRPFTEAEVQAIEGWTLARPLLLPRRPPAPPYDALLTAPESWPTRADPVFDDQPFYFAIEKPWGLPTFLVESLGRIVVGGALLCALLALLGRPRRREDIRPFAASTIYFACLGLGFIALELAMFQKLVLLLGHPIFTLSVLLVTLLAAGGAGSALSHKVAAPHACLVVGILGSSAALWLPGLVEALLPLELGWRIAAAVAIVAPLGLVMGMPFPLGLRRAGQDGVPSAPWCWALNGVTSVLGSIGAVLVAVFWGFRASMLCASACYALAALAGAALTRTEVLPAPADPSTSPRSAAGA